MKAPRPVFVVDDEKQVLDSVRCLLQTINTMSIVIRAPETS